MVLIVAKNLNCVNPPPTHLFFILLCVTIFFTMKTVISVVCAVIQNMDNSVLIARRSGGHLDGFWEFPGGKVEADESLNEALIREIKEELNLSIIVNRHLISSLYNYPHISVQLEAFLCSTDDIVVKSSAHSAVRFIPIFDLNKYNIAPADVPIVNLLTKMNCFIEE